MAGLKVGSLSMFVPSVAAPVQGSPLMFHADVAAWPSLANTAFTAAAANRKRGGFTFALAAEMVPAACQCQGPGWRRGDRTARNRHPRGADTAEPAKAKIRVGVGRWWCVDFFFFFVCARRGQKGKKYMISVRKAAAVDLPTETFGNRAE
jgi:hypothetical protein